MQYEFESLLVNIISVVFVFIGGCFALLQWRKSLVYKRTEMVQHPNFFFHIIGICGKINLRKL